MRFSRKISCLFRGVTNEYKSPQDDERYSIEVHPSKTNVLVVSTPNRDGSIRKEIITIQSPFEILEKARLAGR